MNVKLAAQTLSLSVANALELCQGKNYGVNFDWSKDDLGPTIKFLKIFNNTYDVLNSRNWDGINYRKPLSEET